MKEKKLEKPSNLQDLEVLQLKIKSNAANVLYDGKTPQYPKRFKSWAKQVYRGEDAEHFNNLVDALLSGIAHLMVTGQHENLKGFSSNDSVIFLRGQVQGILTVQEWLRVAASETKVTSEED